MQAKTWVEVSKSALQANISELRKMISESVSLLAVVKANAYGVGMDAVVPAIHSLVDWFGVDSLDEANQARSTCQNPILILGYVAMSDVPEVIRNKFSTVVYTYALAAALSNAATKDNPAKVHIKVDTGLVRLGLLPEDVIMFAKKISTLPNITIEGIYTHYAKLVDDHNVEAYHEPLKKFNDVIDSLAQIGIRPKLKHTASSIAAVMYEDTRFNMVRFGIPIYGFWGRESSLSLLGAKHAELALHPAITWKTTVVHVKKIPAYTGVGYGHSEIVPRETTIAVLGAGFYDGIDKRYGKVGSVLTRERKAKILGGISMNMCIVDVTGIENVAIGDAAVLIGQSGGEEITAYEFAKMINTSTYEVIARINPLLPRILVA